MAFQPDFELTNLSMTTYGVSAILFGMPANAVIVKYGIRGGCIMGSSLMALGSLVRLLLRSHFRFAIAGQIITGAGLPLLLNGVWVYSDQSFSKRRVAVQVGFLILAFVGGIGLGSLLSSMIEDKDSASTSKEDVMKDVF